MRITAVVTGINTGYAIWDRRITQYGILGPKEHHSDLWMLLAGEWRRSNVFIYETTDWTKEPTSVVLERRKLEYTGVIKTAAEIFDIRLVAQSADARNWPSTDQMKIWDSNPELHRGLDAPITGAARHVLYYLTHNIYVSDKIRQEALKRIEPGPGPARRNRAS